MIDGCGLGTMSRMGIMTQRASPSSPLPRCQETRGRRVVSTAGDIRRDSTQTRYLEDPLDRSSSYGRKLGKPPSNPFRADIPDRFALATRRDSPQQARRMRLLRGYFANPCESHATHDPPATRERAPRGRWHGRRRRCSWSPEGCLGCGHMQSNQPHRAGDCDRCLIHSGPVPSRDEEDANAH